MNNQSFEQLLQTFKLTKLRFTIELQQDVYLPVFTGSTIHGLLGWALKRYQPVLFDHLYQVDGIKSYAVIAPEQHSSHEKSHKRGWNWHKGELFSFEIRLFGEACQQAQTGTQNYRSHCSLWSILWNRGNG